MDVCELRVSEVVITRVMWKLKAGLERVENVIISVPYSEIEICRTAPCSTRVEYKITVSLTRYLDLNEKDRDLLAVESLPSLLCKQHSINQDLRRIKSGIVRDFNTSRGEERRILYGGLRGCLIFIDLRVKWRQQPSFLPRADNGTQVYLAYMSTPVMSVE